MGQKGFTLVEILAVIVILSILMTIGGISVFSVINTSQEKLAEEQEKSLKDTAITYVESKKYYLKKCSLDFNPESIQDADAGCYKEISINDLITSSFFENKKDLCDTTQKIIVYKENKGSYTELKSYVPEGTCKY